MSFLSSAAYTSAMSSRPGIAVVTGGKAGIGRALAEKLASFPFIDEVLTVSRSITNKDVESSPKLTALAADVGTAEGRELIVGLGDLEQFSVIGGDGHVEDSILALDAPLHIHSHDGDNHCTIDE